MSLYVEEVVGMHGGPVRRLRACALRAPQVGGQSLPGVLPCCVLVASCLGPHPSPSRPPRGEGSVLHTAGEDMAAKLSHLSKVTQVRSGVLYCPQVCTPTAAPCSHLGHV